MGKVHGEIDDRLAAWLAAQPMFVVATAPLAGDGLINASPKGGSGTFAVLGPTTVAYLDLTGSGAETIAHTRENGRLTIMFCSFEEKPNIVRLFGRGEAVLPGDDRFPALASRFPANPGTRSVVRLDVTKVTTSCGYSVPMMDLVGHRDTLDRWAERKGPDGIAEYWGQKNQISIDGLPALAD